MQIFLMMLVFLALVPNTTTARPLLFLNVLETQVMLDRAGFSPGVIDGRMGTNTKKALAIFQKEGSEEPVIEPVTRYRITSEDAAGPFMLIPSDMMQKASLSTLGYTSLLEEIAERFHSTPMFLQQLNPAASFVEGEEIDVPNVVAMVTPVGPSRTYTRESTEGPVPEATPIPEPGRTKPNVIVTVSKSMSALIVRDTGGHVVFYAPVTTGSRHDPLPIGKWKVNGVQYNPVFRYNPRLFWDADSKDVKATIPAGPNNPVGLVWIDISKEHYGLHGTPEPSQIGYIQSHGCVRLTNWDALTLADLVKPGTRVIFKH